MQFLETTAPNAPVDDGVVVCQARTTKLLLPGECEIVVCNAELKDGGNTAAMASATSTRG